MPKFSKIPNWIPILIITVSFLGFADATYLTVLHYENIIPPCTILHGCEKVTTSAYSVIFGIPLALFGAIYYLTIFFSSLGYFQTKNIKWLNVIAVLSILGFIASLFLMYIQFFVIGSICIYCTFSALTSTTIFAAMIFAYFGKPAAQIQ